MEHCIDNKSPSSSFPGLLCLGFLIFLSAGMVSFSARSDEFRDSTSIRDAEIESTLKSYISPVFKVAGLNPKTLKIHLIVNKQLNAMASVGYQFFLFTGLLLKAENVGQIIGVLAHETGHIADGHVERMIHQSKKMTVLTVAHLLLGAATAIAGSADAGMAIGMGGMGMAQNNFLHYHRGQESAADQDALRYLDKLGWSAKGMEEFLNIIRQQEYFSSSHQDPYLRTHPFTQDRIESVKRHLKNSQFTHVSFPEGFDLKFKMMQAKLLGFLDPTKALRKYQVEDTSLPSRYARAIAHYRLQNLSKSLNLLETLLRDQPQNPYFWELKGQILFENGKIKESLKAYEKSVSLAPQDHLIKINYAHALLEMNAPAHTARAEKILTVAQSKESENAFLWHLLAIIYGRGQKGGLMSLALAEKALLRGEFKMALNQVNRSLKKLSKGSRSWNRAQDLMAHIKQEIDS